MKIIIRKHLIEERESDPWAGIETCRHYVASEILTDKGERIQFPKGAVHPGGGPLYAIIATTNIHRRDDVRQCADIERESAALHHDTTHRVIESLRGMGHE